MGFGDLRMAVPVAAGVPRRVPYQINPARSALRLLLSQPTAGVSRYEEAERGGSSTMKMAGFVQCSPRAPRLVPTSQAKEGDDTRTTTVKAEEVELSSSLVAGDVTTDIERHRRVQCWQRTKQEKGPHSAIGNNPGIP